MGGGVPGGATGGGGFEEGRLGGVPGGANWGGGGGIQVGRFGVFGGVGGIGSLYLPLPSL